MVITLNCLHLYPQINPRNYNPNYAYTVFEDEFNGSLEKWTPGIIYRGIGQLIFSSSTHEVTGGELRLKMIHSLNNPEYPLVKYFGAEFMTNQTFLYGIFECRASFAKDVGSWPAFWSFHQQPCPDNEGPEIDFAEYFHRSSSNHKLHHVIHHWLSSPCGIPGDEKETGYDTPWSFTPSTNVYKSIWTPEKIEYYVDNALKGTHEKRSNDWFPDKPVAVIVSQ